MFLAILAFLWTFHGAHGIRNLDFPMEKKVEELEMKMEKMETDLKQTFYYIRQKFKTLEKGTGSGSNIGGVEKAAAELAEDYNKKSSQEKEEFLKSFQEKCRSQEASCQQRIAFLDAALQDPCQGDGCFETKETVEAEAGTCIEQKYKFVEWTQALCSKVHMATGAKVGACVKNGVDLLFATSNSVRAQEFAIAPPGKTNLVLWTRVSPELRDTLLRRIPKGFILTETMLGAVARLPGVEDLQRCAWDAVKNMWASNSASLVEEMEGGSKVYFVSGIDLLHESIRPYGKTVAFSLELPQLGQAARNVRELTVVNLDSGTSADHLCAAVRAALEVQSTDTKILLKKANCAHCIQSEDVACMEKCLQFSTKFNTGDLKKVLEETDTFWTLLERAPRLLSSFFKLTKKVNAELTGEAARLFKTLGADGSNALHWAATEGREKAVELLVNSGMDVNSKNRRGLTPLHQAAFGGHEKLAEFLLKAKADVNYRAESSGTPLRLAMNRLNKKEGHKKVAALLKRWGGQYH